MMFLNERISFEIAPSFLIYEMLLSRKDLTSQEQQRYERRRNGLIGELKLWQYIHELKPSNLVSLFDCLFEMNGQEFQIDCLLITSDTIFLLEVKNYSGDYYLEDNKIYHLRSRNEIYHPLTQIDRAEFLFRQLLREMRIDLQVRSYVLFINESFMLYGASVQLPMIFPSQVRRFLLKREENAGRMTERVRHFVNQLMARQKAQSRYEQLPVYSYLELRRGLFCWQCHGELIRDGQLYFSCSRCAGAFHIDDVVMYAVAQFQLLFPDRKIMTKDIREWCGEVVSRTYISRFLRKNLEVTLNSGHTYYTFKNENDPLRIIKEKTKLNFFR